MAFLNKDMFGTSEQERERFRKTAEAWVEAGKPLRIHLGFGQHPLRDFLNLDLVLRVRPDRESAEFFDNCFVFDWPEGLPLPDDCVEFVFHEDMFEHLTQKEQYQLLAEVLRVLKPGGFHRINCPDISYIMNVASDFSKGRAGVYDEWDRWAHVNVPTRASLEEQAKIVGYEKVHFNGKNQTVSGVWFRERRPGGQYDQNRYNIFADLEKRAVARASEKPAAARPLWVEGKEEEPALLERLSRMASLVEDGEFAAAEEIFDGEREAVERSHLDPVNVAVMRLALRRGRTDLAIAHALRVDAKNRQLVLNRPEWAYEIATLLEGVPGHTGESVAIRDRLREVGSLHPAIFLRLLSKCAPLGNESGAGALLGWLAETPVDHPLLVERLARRLQAAGRTGDAIDLCRRQLDATPDDPAIRTSLARLLLLDGRLDEASVELEKLHERDRENEWVALGLAGALHKQGRLAESLAVVDAFLSHSPENARALAMKARMEWKAGRRTDAAAAARRAIAIVETNGAAKEAMQAILDKTAA